MNKELMFSSLSSDHTTPPDLFHQLDEEFHFTLDAAASQANHLVEPYYALDHPAPERRDGLSSPWEGRVWCNPPYGREVGKWLSKGWEAVTFEGAELVVFLLPARTDTAWFHNFCWGEHVERRFIKRRLKFGGAKTGAPFPSMVVVMRRRPSPYEWSVL